MERKKIILILMVSLVMACNSLFESGKGADNQKITPLTRPWELSVKTGGVPKGLDSLSASDCGECHVEFYREWSTSTHSKAWQDYQFQEEWEKNDKLFICINCHTPLENQQEFEVLGLIDGDHFRPKKRLNQKFDKNLQQESITCAVCHVRNGKIIGPFGNKWAPHAVMRDPDFLSEGICECCHQANEMIREDLVCAFKTSTEWENGPYAKNHITCIDCHMPQVKRRLTPTSSRERQTRRHFWRGSGIAKFKGEEQQARSFFRSGLELMLTASKAQYLPGDNGTVTVTYINQRAGHNIPTGDPERFIIIVFQLTDERGTVIHQEKIRIGQIWKWEPKAKQISDNSLKPLERRTIDIDFTLPPQAGHYQFTAVVENHRILEQYAKDMNLIGRYPMKAEVQRVSIPIKVVQN